ncbi:unnamed protein product, partial [Dicrocoelium dendriticum]
MLYVPGVWRRTKVTVSINSIIQLRCVMWSTDPTKRKVNSLRLIPHQLSNSNSPMTADLSAQRSIILRVIDHHYPAKEQKDLKNIGCEMSGGESSVKVLTEAPTIACSTQGTLRVIKAIPEEDHWAPTTQCTVNHSCLDAKFRWQWLAGPIPQLTVDSNYIDPDSVSNGSLLYMWKLPRSGVYLFRCTMRCICVNQTTQSGIDVLLEVLPGESEAALVKESRIHDLEKYPEEINKFYPRERTLEDFMEAIMQTVSEDKADRFEDDMSNCTSAAPLDADSTDDLSTTCPEWSHWSVTKHIASSLSLDYHDYAVRKTPENPHFFVLPSRWFRRIHWASAQRSPKGFWASETEENTVSDNFGGRQNYAAVQYYRWKFCPQEQQCPSSFPLRNDWYCTLLRKNVVKNNKLAKRNRARDTEQHEGNLLFAVGVMSNRLRCHAFTDINQNSYDRWLSYINVLSLLPHSTRRKRTVLGVRALDDNNAFMDPSKRPKYSPQPGLNSAYLARKNKYADATRELG